MCILSRVTVQSLAQSGLRAMEQSPQAGLHYLDSIQQIGSYEERTFARYAKLAPGMNLHDSSARHTRTIALEMLASGLNGPLAVALATLGARALPQRYSDADGRNIGLRLLVGVRDNTSHHVERELASTAVNAGVQFLCSRDAHNLELQALKAIADGVSGSLYRTLGDIGGRSVAFCHDQGDRRRIGQAFLTGIRDGSCNPRAKLLASTAIQATSPSSLNDLSAANTELAALDLIAQGNGTLAELGQTVKPAYSDADARTMAFPILRAIMAHPESPDDRILAETALQASCEYLTPSAAVAIQQDAFRTILHQ